MAGKRHYDDGCAAAHALDLVGERWALLVVRELLLGPRRFTDLRAGLPGISPNVLSQRLSELERASIVVRRRLPPPGAARVYALTDWGRELEPAIQALGRWAARSPARPRDLPMSASSLILSFRTMVDADRARGLAGTLELRLGEQHFRARLAEGRLALLPGEAERPDAVIAGSPDALAAVAYGGRPLDEALAEGALTVTGDRDLAARFLGLFPLPAPAPATADPA
ncbi:transcriptional regulator, HxlR family [Tistlia consotensis]|uniref:Transcriptional regulator, HxlR family n=1 Tax=Tistlia consotensis USBA 355 TaxID=560819 RepID=A0A1Y6CCG8_9PROT|nr:winged helix-turn-helix transcriptional regulator [Tistlia consotensis]SMF48212.1 transcriptional regulator, HxlR family [Tistlia consotensis USBA 355]SNR81627.1 transcriptional regulator, HxlR family [Tistlia consotensis]